MTRRARGRDKLSTGSSPLLLSGLHNSSSCEIEPKAPSHLHGRAVAPSGRSANRCVVTVCVAG